MRTITKEEADLKAEAAEMIQRITVFDAKPIPGDWIKKWGSHFPNLGKLKAKHFQHRVK